MLSKMAHTHTKKQKKVHQTPAAKMHLALLHCGTDPRKLIVGWSRKKRLGLSKHSSISHFTCLQFWIKLVLLDRVTSHSHCINNPDLQREHILNLLIAGLYFAHTMALLEPGVYELAQSRTNSLLGMSRNKRKRRRLSTPSIPPLPPDTRTNTQRFSYLSQCQGCGR